MLGLMVSIGAAGVVGQIASGIIIVYTYALKVGEYVRIQEHEGTVTEVSLFVTRLRIGLVEEIAIPNAVVLGNVTRNYSRVAGGKGYVLDTSVTIGYDTPLATGPRSADRGHAQHSRDSRHPRCLCGANCFVGLLRRLLIGGACRY